MRPEEAEALQIATKLEAVAWSLAQGEPPPQWVTPLLFDQGRLINGRQPGPYDDDYTKKLIKKATDLERALSIYGEIESEYGLPAGEAVEHASTALVELIDHLESELRPPRRGGPTPDGRRRICAAVCAYVWRRLHGKVQRYSPRLQEVCEQYWKACGQPETGDSSKGNTAKNWEEFSRVILTTASTPSVSTKSLSA